jgi:hypothetical protein
VEAKKVIRVRFKGAHLYRDGGRFGHGIEAGKADVPLALGEQDELALGGGRFHEIIARAFAVGCNTASTTRSIFIAFDVSRSAGPTSRSCFRPLLAFADHGDGHGGRVGWDAAAAAAAEICLVGRYISSKMKTSVVGRQYISSKMKTSVVGRQYISSGWK